MATQQPQQPKSMIDVKLNSPRTPEHHQQMPQPYRMTTVTSTNGTEAQLPAIQNVRSWNQPHNDGKPYVRFYAIGNSTQHVQCPLCKERADTITATPKSAFDNLNCILSLFSCCFPLFALSCLYTTCFQKTFKSERKFCNKCGGYLGFYMRPH